MKKIKKVKAVQTDPEQDKTLPPTMPYTASVKVLGKVFKATGLTVTEAIANLKPGNCRGAGVLGIEKKDGSQFKVIHPIIMLRLFNSHGITREIALKNASLLFHI